jgi:hypothetical protein
MTRDQPAPGLTAEAPMDAQALREEITQTRSDLGATIEALAAKTDVKARAKEKAAYAGDQAKESLRAARASFAAQVRRRPLTIAAGATLGALVGLGVYLLVRR